MKNLKQLHIVITGATGGIGKAFAQRCAQENTHLHLVQRTPQENLKEELLKMGAASVTQYCFDLANREEVEALIAKLSDVPIAILFNNAGLLTGGQLEEQPLEDIYKMLQVNLTSLVHLTRGLLPDMLKRKNGKIINNASVSAVMNFPCASTYAASKAAVMAFTNCLELELKGTGVSTLLLLTPGIKTKMYDAIAPLYGKNLDVPDEYISAEQYADMILKAVISNQTELVPSIISKTGIGLRIAKYMSPVFKLAIKNKYQRLPRN